MDQTEKFKKLRRFNIFMAILHFGQGIAMLMVSSGFKLPVTGSFLKYDVISQQLVPSTRT